ncbi:PhnB protein [Chryseolinea serpens]|uniref:PhnB protein n=2 Tax=Chryseolinea serpens TaxID=947013 RepID=A0A1M5SA95_9BACT|nr:PhnB protein [Chryseolinea serpens]
MFVPKSIVSESTFQLTESPLFIPPVTPQLCVIKPDLIQTSKNMASISSYLTFSGNCLEAMTFYKECLGGELVLQTVGESPLAAFMPSHMKHYVLNSTLTNDTLVLMGSDMVPETGLSHGNSISMMLRCNSEEQARTYYSRLATDGVPTHPLEDTFWGAVFGDLTDKFGNHWLLYFEKKSNA